MIKKAATPLGKRKLRHLGSLIILLQKEHYIRIPNLEASISLNVLFSVKRRFLIRSIWKVKFSKRLQAVIKRDLQVWINDGQFPQAFIFSGHFTTLIFPSPIQHIRGLSQYLKTSVSTLYRPPR